MAADTINFVGTTPSTAHNLILQKAHRALGRPSGSQRTGRRRSGSGAARFLACLSGDNTGRALLNGGQHPIPDNAESDQH